MKTPKTLTQIANEVGAFVEPITFKAHGTKKRGWAIVDSDNNELLEIQPVYYSNGDRWLVKNRTNDKASIQYTKSIRQVKANIKIGWTGFKFSGLTSGNSGKSMNYGTIINA